MKKLLAISTLSLSALALTAGQVNAAVLIDNFNSGTVFESVLPRDIVSGTSTPAPGDIISTTREFVFDVSEFNGVGESPSPSIFSIAGRQPVMSISTAPGRGIFSFAELTYSEGGPFNLAAGGANLIGFDILNNNEGANVRLNVDRVSVVTRIARGQTGPFTLPFTSFPNVNFSSVRNIRLEVITDSDSNFVIDNFQTSVIPEPMTILGTGFALAALPALKKAHKNKKAQ